MRYLGWRCLWVKSQTASLMLYAKCRADAPGYMHTHLCKDYRHYAAGGWFESAKTLSDKLHLPHWEPDDRTSRSAIKASLFRHRRDIVLPAVESLYPQVSSPPLPWGWLALEAGRGYQYHAFVGWWQVRCLGTLCPKRGCGWCGAVQVTRSHLASECLTFQTKCWCAGILPD